MLLAQPWVSQSADDPIKIDNRWSYLGLFFTKYHCPDFNYTLINDYINAVDQNHIDYRILPAVSVQESSCGKPPAVTMQTKP